MVGLVSVSGEAFAAILGGVASRGLSTWASWETFLSNSNIDFDAGLSGAIGTGLSSPTWWKQASISYAGERLCRWTFPP